MPSWIQFFSSNHSFNVNTSDPIDVMNYTLKISAVTSDNLIAGSATFTLAVL